MKFDTAKLKLDPRQERVFNHALDWLESNGGHVGKASEPTTSGLGMVLFFSKQGQIGRVLPAGGKVDQNEVSAMIQNLRKDCDAVVYISEAWMLAMRMKDDEVPKTPADAWKEANKFKGPIHKNPEREEVVLVGLYVKDRTVILAAPINRGHGPGEPPFGGLRVMNDSAEGSMLSGRLV